MRVPTASKEKWPMSQFVPVARVSELSPGQMKMVVADQERLLLVNMAGTFYAISDECGHDWAPLSRGKLEGHVVVCPRHFARYDVRTGQLLSGPLADDVPVYEVRIEEDTVYVKL
jgi:nitrite reductase/ring-hydroxylating ferredoxin subunit